MHEQEYIAKISLDHRKEYGQFFTPPLVANMMVKWICKSHPRTILDPAFGLGIFFDVVTNLPIENRPEFTAYEIDKHLISFIGDGFPRNLTLINQDYLESVNQVFDAIVCNQPYMKFQKFLNRHNVLADIEDRFGKKLAGYTNISSVFLVKAIQELNDNGRLAFIMPFEFFNTGYGNEVKRNLLEDHLLKQIVVFTNEKEIFPDATTTVCLLLCEKDHRSQHVKITSIDSNQELKSIIDIEQKYEYTLDVSDLPYDQKWTPIINSLYQEHTTPDEFRPLSLYGIFKRGIATGANEFFSLSKSNIEEFDIGVKNYAQCVTKSSQIRKLVFTEHDFQKLSKNNKPVFCLDVQEHNRQGVLDYIKLGESKSFHRRYLTKMRSPWYKIEKRTPAPLLVGVFNRGRTKIIRNLTSSINFTCFHSFYPSLFGENNVDKIFVYLISDVGQSIIKQNKRNYGMNLDKYEPGDLNEVLCPNQNQFDSILDIEAQEVVNIAKYDETAAIQLSNTLIKRLLNPND